MQNKDVDIFLDLVNTRNITKTAENLFLSQSVISTRLKRLEEELGYELFTRGKGMREIDLTRQGRDFISVAMRFHNLYEEASLIQASTRSVLRIASPESVYFDFLEPLMMEIMRDYPRLKISTLTCDSSEVYDLMEKGLIDFGFASYESSHRNVTHSHIYTQPFCLVSWSGALPEGEISPDVLDTAKEIRLSGGNFVNVSQWRDTWFPGEDSCRIEVNSPHMIVKCLKETGGWSILPKATAKLLSKLYGVNLHELKDAPESRKIYLLRHSGNKYDSTGAMESFETALEGYLEERKNKS